MGEAEVADGLIARDAGHEDLARDEDEVRADGERELLPPVEEGAHAAAEQRERANRALERATCFRTRLALLPGADELEREAAREAGYCCFQPSISSSLTGATSTRKPLTTMPVTLREVMA